MSRHTEFAKSHNGIVHVVNPLQGEHTLCGDAFDIDSEKGDEQRAWNPSKCKKEEVVTCTYCAMVIFACKGVKVKI